MRKIIFFIVFFAITLSLIKSAYAQTPSPYSPSNTVRTRVGNPPIAGGCWPASGGITQGPDGATSHNALHIYDNADAIDIGNGMGTPIYATFDGKVKVFDCVSKGLCEGGFMQDGIHSGGYGNLVILFPDTNPTAKVYFAHLSKLDAINGATVSKGAKLGGMGATGRADGVHLHYEFRGGMKMEAPNIPESVTPRNCNGNGACKPSSITADPQYCAASTTPSPKEAYWFLLHRKSNTEELYKGTPGDKANSQLVRNFKVRVGKPGERPTPLPQLLGREYWKIEWKRAESGPTAPYMMKLDIPITANAPYGPTPYNECNGQCNWQTPGDFGLHGVNGDNSRIDNDGSQDVDWSSGCIRHYDRDITDLYNLLDPSKEEIRYYIEDN